MAGAGRLRRIGSPEELEAVGFGETFLFPTPWGELARCYKEGVEDGVTNVGVLGTYVPGNPFYETVCEYMGAGSSGTRRSHGRIDGRIGWIVSISEHKSCPFCGEEFTVGVRRYYDYDSDGERIVRTGEHWSVTCPWCGTRGPSGETADDAWQVWDRGMHGERDDCAEAYRRVGHEVYLERLEREGWIDG